jgi:hypothetical protein
MTAEAAYAWRAPRPSFHDTQTSTVEAEANPNPPMVRKAIRPGVHVIEPPNLYKIKYGYPC